MNQQVRNGLLAFLLIPICLLTIGIKLFHNCNNLSHVHNETCIELGHEKCLICDFKLQPSLEMSIPVIEPITIEHISEFQAFTETISCQLIEAAANKGPPALV